MNANGTAEVGEFLRALSHRGAKVRADSDELAFEDGTGLPAIVELVGRSMRATA